MARPTNQLLDALRTVITDMASVGGGRARDAAERLREAFPELVAQYSEALTIKALVDMARKEFKRRLPLAEAADLQPIFPAVQEHLQKHLPGWINIPDPEEEGEFIYRPLAAATMAELDACIEARNEQLQADLQALRALTELREFRQHQGAGPTDKVLAPVLEPAE